MPGGLVMWPRLHAWAVLFALPMWWGFSPAVPCKALSSFLSGFYSVGINSRPPSLFLQMATISPSCNATQPFYPVRGGFCGRLRPVFGSGRAAVPLQFPPPWRSACRLWCFPRRQGRAAPHQLPSDGPPTPPDQISHPVFAPAPEIPQRGQEGEP